MKHIVLIRHSKSSWKFPDLKDKERPLKKRGLNDAQLMSKVLKDKHIIPDLIICSPAVRALSTAKIFAVELGYDENLILVDSQLYLKSKEKLLKSINSIDDKYSTVLFVGHNPGVTELANSLTVKEEDNIPTSGMMSIEFDCNSWTEVKKGMGRKIFFETPKMQKTKVEKNEEPIL